MRVSARAAAPCSAEDVARAYNFLGIKTVRACTNSASELSTFTRWYTKRLLAHLHLDVKPLDFDPFHREMGKVFNVARFLANSENPSRPFGSAGYAARPASVVHSDRLSRGIASRNAQLSSQSCSRSSVSRRGGKSPACNNDHLATGVICGV